MLTSKEIKPEQCSIDDETIDLVTLVFGRFADLYHNKCKSHGLLIFLTEKDEAIGRYSDTFHVWCHKLKHLDQDRVAYGVKRLEGQIAERSRYGEESWPPSYAEFVGLCEEKYQTRCHKPFDSSKALENKTYIERQRAYNRKKCADLLKSLDL